MSALSRPVLTSQRPPLKSLASNQELHALLGSVMLRRTKALHSERRLL